MRKFFKKFTFSIEIHAHVLKRVNRLLGFLGVLLDHLFELAQLITTHWSHFLLAKIENRELVRKFGEKR